MLSNISNAIDAAISLVKMRGIISLLRSQIAMAVTKNITVVEPQFGWIESNDKGSELQLEVRQMPLFRVLNSMMAKTGVPIHFSVVPEGLVTATCNSICRPL